MKKSPNNERIARQEAQSQWEAYPCAANTVVGKVHESLEYFREARRVRYEEYAPWLIRATNISNIQHCKVLEIGVGLGQNYHTLARSGNQMHALDLSREHLRLTQKHLFLEGLRTEVTHGDMENMPFPDRYFDIVYSFGVLHHTDHMDRAVNEIHRVLKPGGRAIISVYNRDSIFFWCRTFLFSGILKCRFLRYGYKRTLAKFEWGAGDHIVPTVNVLSRSKLRRLFGQFSITSLKSHHAALPELINRILTWIPKDSIKSAMNFAGWYLTIIVTKKYG